MIALSNVTKRYQTRHGTRAVLDRVNLRVERGDRLGILGRNGSGKSTLIRVISGAEQPTSGEVHRGLKVSWPLAFTGGFQAYLTGLDNIRFICRIYGVDHRDVIPYVEEFSELGSDLREPVMHYSSGMTARLAFALTMAIEFDCFLVDEVIAVGDSRFHEKCRAELFEKRRDRALILVSHDPHTIRDHCDKAAVLVGGRIIPFGCVDDAYDYYGADAA